MKNTIKRIIAGVVFIMLFAVIFLYEGRIVHPENTESGSSFSMWDYYYAEDDDTISTALIGSSAIYRYWIAPQAYEKYGFTSYLLSTEMQPFDTVPYIMEEAVRSQDLDLIVVETRSAVTEDVKAQDPDNLMSIEEMTEEKMFYMSEVSAAMKPSIAKAKMVNDMLIEDGASAKFKWLMPLLKYHDNELTISADERVRRMNEEKHIYKSATQSSKVEPQKPSKVEYNDRYELSSEKKQEIDAIAKKANELGVQLLFVSTPYCMTSDIKYTVQTQLEEYMAEQGYPYLNMLEHMDEMQLSYETDFYNENHVNIVGGEKCTDLIAEYIVENYELNTDMLNEAQKLEWQQACEQWDAKAADNREEYLADIKKLKQG